MENFIYDFNIFDVLSINHKIAYITQKIELCKADVCNSDNIIRRTFIHNKANQKTG